MCSIFSSAVLNLAVSYWFDRVMVFPDRSCSTIAPSITVISPESTSPAIIVPRMPMDPDGVSIMTSSGSSRPINPEVNTNTPFNTEKLDVPDCVDGSKTYSSIERRASSDTAKDVSSTKIMLTAPLSSVSIISPW